MLLILDFDGVCVRGLGEAMPVDPRESTNDAAIDLAASERPRAHEVVGAAHAAGMAVVVLSNEISETWVDRMPILQAVDHVIACSDNGILKPDRRAFQRCLLKTGADAAHTVVVDDHPDNVTVAATLGMTTVLFDPNGVDASWDATLAAIHNISQSAHTAGHGS